MTEPLPSSPEPSPSQAPKKTDASASSVAGESSVSLDSQEPKTTDASGAIVAVESSASMRAWWWLPPLLLVVGVLVVYGQVVTFSFVNWDDPAYIYRNPVLLYPERMSWWDRWFPSFFGYPMPLTVLSLRLDQWLYGVPVPGVPTRLSQGWGFHVTNLALWLALVLLLYRFCRERVGSRWAAFAGVALFAFHPTAAETVAWVTARKELLVGLFGVVAMIALFRWVEAPIWRRALWLLLASLAALMSKPNAVFLLPLGLWTVVVRPGQERAGVASGSRLRAMVWQGLAVGAVVGGVALWVVGVGMRWQQKLGAVDTSRSWWEVMDRALWALGYHSRLALAPFRLRVKYVVEPDGLDGFHLLGLLVLVGALILLLHPRTRRGIAGLGAVLCLTAYLPVSNLVPLSRFLADTYLFLPMMGVALLVAEGLRVAHRRWQKQWTWVAPGLALVGVGLMVLTAQQVRVWENSVSLWQQAYRYHPDSPRVCRMLGFAYNETSQLKNAAATYEMCIRRFGPTLYQNNLAITLFLLRQWDRAKHHFQQVLARQPHHARARRYLAWIEQVQKAETRKERKGREKKVGKKRTVHER